jgi:AraC-like DNA-binding protein
MDVLSDVITSMRTGRPAARRAVFYPPWGHRYAAQPGTAGFKVVLQGSCWHIPRAGDPVHLGVGDVLFAPHGDGYGLADSPATPLSAISRDDLQEEADPFAATTIGRPGNGESTVILCGGYYLDPSRTHPLLRDLPDVVHLPANPGCHPELRAAMDTLGAEIDNPRLGAGAVVPVLLDMLLLYLLRAWFEDQPARSTATGWAAALADPQIRAALNAIHHDPAHPWTVQTLADRVRLSRAAFSRRFSTLTGEPPLTYLTWWRLTIAASLLRESDAVLDEVATRVGYTSEFAFANAFKRQYGVAPGRFRRSGRRVTADEQVSSS